MLSYNICNSFTKCSKNNEPYSQHKPSKLLNLLFYMCKKFKKCNVKL